MGKILAKIIVVSLSLLIIACGIMTCIVSRKQINDAKDLMPSNSDTDKYFFIFKTIILVIGLVLIEIGLLGVLVAWKQNKCLIFLFDFQVFILACLFLAIGIAALVALKKFFDDVSCNNLQWFNSADAYLAQT